MAILFGRATIMVNGKLYDSMKGATLDVGGVKRTSKVSSNKVPGATEEIMPSKVEFSLPLSSDIKVSDFDVLDVSILFKTDVGINWTVPRAWRTDPVTTGDADGELKVMYEGEPAEQH